MNRVGWNPIVTLRGWPRRQPPVQGPLMQPKLQADTVRFCSTAGDTDGTLGLWDRRLLIGAAKGLKRQVRLSLENGANREARDYKGLTPFLRAVGARKDDIAYYLADKKKANVHATDGQSWNALMLLDGKNSDHLPMAKYLVGKGLSVDHRSDDFYTPLLLEMEGLNLADDDNEADHDQVALFYLDCTKQPNQQLPATESVDDDEDGFFRDMKIRLSDIEGELEELQDDPDREQELLEERAAMMEQMQCYLPGEAPIQRAAEFGLSRVMQKLKDLKADPNLMNYGEPPVFTLIENAMPKIAYAEHIPDKALERYYRTLDTLLGFPGIRVNARTILGKSAMDALLEGKDLTIANGLPNQAARLAWIERFSKRLKLAGASA